MVVIQDFIVSVSMAEPLPLLTPCPELTPTPALKHSPPVCSRGDFCRHHSPQRYLAPLTLIQSLTPHQGQQKKTDRLLATTMQGEDEALKIPALKEPLYWPVREGSQTGTHSQAQAVLLFFIGGDKWFLGICASALESTSRNIWTLPGSWQCLWAWNPCWKGSWMVPFVHPSESHFWHACWALFPPSPCLAPGPYRIGAGQTSVAAFYQPLEIGPVSISKSLIWCYVVGQNVLLFRPYCQSLLILQHHDLLFEAM